MLVAVTLVTAVGAAFRTAVLLHSHLHPQAVVMAGVGLAALGIYLTLRRTDSALLGGNLLTGLFFAAGTFAIVQRGGIGAPVVIAMSALPIVATLVCGTRSGTMWLVLVIADVLVIAALEQGGLDLQDQLAPHRALFVHTVGAIIFFVALFGIGRAYEAPRRAALADALEAEREAARAEEEVRMTRVERMATIGQLAAGVAHEVNNPLAYVAGNLSFLRDNLDGDDSIERATRVAMMEAASDALLGIERIAVIVRDLKTFVRDRDSSGDIACNVGNVIASVLRLTEKQRAGAAGVVVSVPEPSPWAVATEAKLAQVVLNLVINALQAFDDEAEATIRISVEDAVLEIEDAERDGVAIVVADDGAGMSEETLNRAMEPFFTTKPVGVGTGLGLSVCRNIIQDLGGWLEIDSELGRGTTVRILLARAEPIGDEEVPASPIAPPAPARLSILVVDDEPLVLRSLRRTVVGHDLTVAHGGEEALRRIADGGTFDVILCDLMMPDTTGVDVYERVLTERPDLADRFVFLTGGVYGDRERAFLEAFEGMVLDKPISPDRLERVFHEVAGPVTPS